MILTVMAGAMLAEACVLNESDGKLSYAAQPTPQYEAANRSWYIAGEMVEFREAKYSQYGNSRKLFPTEVRAIGVLDKLPVFVANDATDLSIIYIMARSWNCTFQPYLMKRD